VHNRVLKIVYNNVFYNKNADFPTNINLNTIYTNTGAKKLCHNMTVISKQQKLLTLILQYSKATNLLQMLLLNCELHSTTTRKLEVHNE